MTGQEIAKIRRALGKTQDEFAELICLSSKAVQSYEEGWRPVSVHAERQSLFLLALKTTMDKWVNPCWQIRECAPELRTKCVAWEFKAGHFCWLLAGTACDGKYYKDWRKKMIICRECKVFKAVVPI